MAKQKTGKYAERRERFVRVWQAAKSIREVAETMGFSMTRAYQLVAHLRRLGVPLKQMERSKTSFAEDEIARLKALCNGSE